MRRYIILLVLISGLVSVFFSVNAIAVDNTLLPAVEVNNDVEKWGYIDTTGNYSIKPIFDYASDFTDKGIAIVSKKGKYTFEVGTILFIDRSGKTLLGPYEAYIPEFKDGIAIVRRDGQTDLVVDSSGKIMLESKYDLHCYSGGMLNFSQVSSNNKRLYGYMDLKGKIVIPAKYQYAQNFTNGRAYVLDMSGSYLMIDKSGKELEKTDKFYGYFFSEGFSNYYDKNSGKYGYKQQDGKVAISPRFDMTEGFHDSCAVIAMEYDDIYYKYGLIDKKGNYIIKPEYSGMKYLGQGLYAVSKDFYSPNSDYFMLKAIFNNKGQRLTDFIYRSVEEFHGGYASACDDLTTFVIVGTGNVVERFPRLNGIGNMEFVGDIIKAEIDGGLTYLNKNREVIWNRDDTFILDNDIKVNRIKYRRDYLTYVEYPEIEGLGNNKQEDMNKQLKEFFTAEYQKERSEDEFYTSVSVDFSVHLNKNLLIIEKYGYYYPLGAAHGQPSQDYYYTDLKTGVFYKLRDLFKSNSKYVDRLSEVVNKQLQLNIRVGNITGEMSYFTDKVEVAKEQNFVIGKDSMKIYYYPYEIAAYAAGFPEFEIPYGQITDIIDSKGAFWNSFDKEIKSHKINVLSDIENSTIASIASLMDSYEKKMVDAINMNDFSKVENTLLKGSNLYNSQKKLVQSLYKRNIKEKLTRYDIYAVHFDYTKKEYRVFVLEEVAIKYPGKDYANNKYSWCYTVKFDDKAKNYKLSDIQKW